MPGFSIIIPCYNLQDYIAKAVESILHQSFQNFEIILINDGSTDNSLKVLQTLASVDDRIKIIDKKNEGLSAARNSGLDIAQGEYILFLDGDDWLAENSLKELYSKAKTEDLDLLIGDTLFYYSNENIKWVYKRPEYIDSLNVKSGIDYFIALKKEGCYAPMACNQIYKNEFLKKNSFKFVKGLINEDELWTPQVLLQAQKVNCINLPFYYYLQRNNSIMNSVVSPKKIIDNISIANSLIKLIKNQENKELKGWMWVKSYELYYRSITEYNAPKNILRQIGHSNYSIFKLALAKIPDLQFDWCLKYLKYSDKNSFDLLIYLSIRRVIRKFNKLLGL
jgi:glycosyltransferase involved in cell wall biosynthesis